MKDVPSTWFTFPSTSSPSIHVPSGLTASTVAANLQTNSLGIRKQLRSALSLRSFMVCFNHTEITLDNHGLTEKKNVHKLSLA